MNKLQQRVLEINNCLNTGEYDKAIEKTRQLICKLTIKLDVAPISCTQPLVSYRDYIVSLAKIYYSAIKDTYRKQIETKDSLEIRYYKDTVKKLFDVVNTFEGENIDLSAIKRLKDYIDTENAIRDSIASIFKSINNKDNEKTLELAKQAINLIKKKLSEYNIGDKEYKHYDRYLNAVVTMLIDVVKDLYKKYMLNPSDNTDNSLELLYNLLDIILKHKSKDELQKLKERIDIVREVLSKINSLRLTLNTNEYDKAFELATTIRKQILILKQKFTAETSKCDNRLKEVSELLQQIAQRLSDEHESIITPDKQEAARGLEVKFLSKAEECNEDYRILIQIAEINYKYGVRLMENKESKLAINALRDSCTYYKKAKNRLHSSKNSGLDARAKTKLIDSISEKQAANLALLGCLGSDYNKQVPSSAKVLDSIEDENVIIAYAKHCIQQKKYSDAENLLNNINYNPSNYDLVRLYIQIDLAKSRYNGVENRIYDALNSIENDDIRISLCIKLIKLYLRNDRIVEAKATINDLLSKYPDNVNVIYEQILYYLVIEDYESALDLISNNIELLKNNGRFNEDLYFYLIVMIRRKNKENTDDLVARAKGYLQQQLLAYSSINCIKALREINSHATRVSKTKFKKNPSIEDVFKLIQESLQNKMPDEKGLLDTYTIALNSCAAIYNSAPTEMFEVKTISNTKDIVRIVPTGRECHASQKLPSQEEFEFKIEY